MNETTRTVCPACGGKSTQPPALPDGIWPRCSWCGKLPGSVGPKPTENAHRHAGEGIPEDHFRHTLETMPEAAKAFGEMAREQGAKSVENPSRK
ncbi:MAG: hypothetical protein ING19_08165 [Azospirillum sp.]|nr:hypothetical protein [Azospirillum sp.]